MLPEDAAIEEKAINKLIQIYLYSNIRNNIQPYSCLSVNLRILGFINARQMTRSNGPGHAEALLSCRGDRFNMEAKTICILEFSTPVVYS